MALRVAERPFSAIKFFDLDALDADAVLSDSEAAAILGCSCSSLARWRKVRPDYGPKAVWVGTRPGYLVADLREYLAAREQRRPVTTPMDTPPAGAKRGKPPVKPQPKPRRKPRQGEVTLGGE